MSNVVPKTRVLIRRVWTMNGVPAPCGTSNNASPVSVRGALEFLAETPVAARRRRLAVLGDMLELGPDEERLHRELGAVAAGQLDALLAVGPRARWIAEGASAAGLASVLTADDTDQAILVLDRELAPGVGDLLLVKGSRGVELDRLVEAIAAAPVASRSVSTAAPSATDGGGRC